MEATLNETEVQYRLLYEATMDGVLLTAPDGSVLAANPAACHMFQRTEVEMRQVGRVGLVDVTDPRLKKAIEERNKTGKFKGELSLIRKDGTKFTAEITSALFNDSDGHQRTSMIIRDISARKILEEQLRESEKQRFLLKQQEIVQTSLDGFWIVNANNGELLEVNDNYCKMVGYSAEEILKMGIAGLDANETQEESKARIKKIHDVGYDRFETRHRHKQGHLIDLEVSVTHSEADGGKNFAFFRDITERILTEKSVRQSRNQLTTFIQQAPISIAMFDLNMNYLSVSDRWFKEYGRGYDSLIGLNHYVVHPDIPERWKKVHQQALVGTFLENNDDIWIMDDGSKHWLRWSALPWIDEKNNIGGIILSTEDITDSKLLELEEKRHLDDLEQLQKLQIATQTASAVAHEINQPLLAIASYSRAALTMLKSKNPDFDEINNAIKKSEEQSLLAGKSIRDILGFLQRRELLKEAFDLNQEVTDVMGKVKSEHNLVFHTILNLKKDLPLVRANRTHVQKVLINLLRNGIDAMESAGVPLPAITVSVSTTKDNNYAQLTIRDNGPGIPKEHINRLFEPFFTTKINSKGIGLGLAISRSLIEENGGQLWVDPEEGLGATFHLTLPLAL